MATIVHFDLPAEDLDRAASFYGKLFGWKFERMPGPIEYFGITTFDEQGKPSLGGGMGKKNEWDTGITNYVGVDSVEDTLKKLDGARWQGSPSKDRGGGVRFLGGMPRHGREQVRAVGEQAVATGTINFWQII